jgi:hypothetical protein
MPKPSPADRLRPRCELPLRRFDSYAGLMPVSSIGERRLAGKGRNSWQSPALGRPGARG